MKRLSDRGGWGIARALLAGAALPFLLRLTLGRVVWPGVIVGWVVLAAAAVLAGKGRRDRSPEARFEQSLRETIPYDPARQIPVIHCSICTGEKTAGFRNRADGHFTEVMVIRSPEDAERFKRIYQLDAVKTEY